MIKEENLLLSLNVSFLKKKIFNGINNKIEQIKNSSGIATK